MKSEDAIRKRLDEFKQWEKQGLIQHSDEGFGKALEWCLE